MGGRWLVALLLSGCATYSQDLERARRLYQDHEHARALALLRLLGEDLDALEPKERVQYAYLRGMTDLRLAETLPERERRSRAELLACSRDWLGEALRLDEALGPSPPGERSLGLEQLERAREARASLVAVEGPEGACLSLEP